MRLAVAAVAVASLVIGLYVLVRRGNAPASRDPSALAGASTAPIDALAIVPAQREAIGSAASHDAVGSMRDGSPAAKPNPRQEHDAVLADLRESGEGHEVWEAQGTAVLDAFARRAQVTDRGCYVAGCGATLTFPSQAAYRRALDETQASAAYRAWTGGKRLTSPEIATDGQVSIAIAIYRPD